MELSDVMARRAGELAATQAAIRAILRMLPDREHAAVKVEQEIETLISMALPSTMSDEFVEGAEAAKKLFLSAAKGPRGDYGR